LDEWECNIGGTILTGETELMKEEKYVASVLVE
jgi:hypothetical protein